MSDFRKASKTLRFGIQRAMVESMASDPAVRFAYSEALNSRILECLNEPDCYTRGGKWMFLRALNWMFGNEKFSVPQYLYDATDFIKSLSGEEVKNLEISVEFELRDFWLPPLLKAVTLECKPSGVKTRFEDDGEFCPEDFLKSTSEE